MLSSQTCKRVQAWLRVCECVRVCAYQIIGLCTLNTRSVICQYISVNLGKNPHTSYQLLPEPPARHLPRERRAESKALDVGCLVSRSAPCEHWQGKASVKHLPQFCPHPPAPWPPATLSCSPHTSDVQVSVVFAAVSFLPQLCLPVLFQCQFANHLDRFGASDIP